MVKPVEAEDISIEEVPVRTLPKSPMHSMHPMNLGSFNERIVVILARTLQYRRNGKPATYTMEPGRQIAQAAHAVSGLKLRYCEEHGKCINMGIAGLVVKVMENPITTIVLQARDTNELDHISLLAEDKGILQFSFADDNPTVYGINGRITTALALGPVVPEALYGISDYLPLWKDGVTDIG